MWGKGGTLCASQSSPLPPRSFPQQLFSLGRFAAGAEVGHLAFRAAGAAGVADIAAEPDHAVIDVAPFGTGEEAHQILFDVHGIGMGGEPQTVADTLDELRDNLIEAAQCWLLTSADMENYRSAKTI